MRICIAVALVGCLWAGDKRPFTPGKVSDDNVEIRAQVYMTKEEIKKAVGFDLDEGFIVVDVTVSPKNGQTIKLNREDFVLISAKDGQRSSPYLPTQIAGSNALVISQRQSTGGTMAQERRRPMGGLGGGYPMGLPTGAGSIGSATATTTTAEASEKESDGKVDPALAALKEKILQEKEITEPISGQLYFLLEGKVKLKDLDLYYKVPGGRLNLRWVR